jgi:hypothetical protein
LCNLVPTLSTLTIDPRTLSVSQRGSLTDARPNLTVRIHRSDAYRDEFLFGHNSDSEDEYEDEVDLVGYHGEGLGYEEDYGYGMHAAYDDGDGYWDDEGTYHF